MIPPEPSLASLDEDPAGSQPSGPVMGFPEQSWKTYTDNLMSLFEKTKQAMVNNALDSPETADMLRAARLQMMPL